MKRSFFARLLAAALLVALACPAALAAGNPTVEYTGQTDRFVFSSVGDGSPTDLFAAFKLVMPGDTLTQQIDVRNTSDATVRIYLRQEPADEAHRAFLEQMRLSVVSDVGPTELYEAPPDDQDGLAQNVLLGTFLPGAKLTLTATLTVPVTVGNEFADRRGDVVWVFTVEEVPEPTPVPTPTPTPPPGPATGDAANPLPWLLGALGFAAALAVFAVLARRSRGRE